MSQEEEAVKKMKNKKACSWDHIFALKAVSDIVNQILLKIINTAWAEGTIPEHHQVHHTCREITLSIPEKNAHSQSSRHV